MSIKIKNIDTSIHVWGGKEYQVDEIYTCENSTDIRRYGNDSTFITDLANSKAQVYNDDVLVSTLALAIFLVTGSSQYFPIDGDNRPLYRGVITEPEFHYSPRSLDFYTCKYNSLFNRSHYGDGTIDGSPDLGDAWCSYYNASNVELTKGESESAEDFQVRLTANCTKTIMYFEPSFDYDVVGAKLQFRNIPSDRAYFWFVAAPLVPAEYGGNVVFMGGGMNISFFNERDTFECDGKTVSKISYDSVYHSGMIGLIVKHNVGVQIGIQLIYQFYSE